jgi:hypothetical protein
MVFILRGCNGILELTGQMLAIDATALTNLHETPSYASTTDAIPSNS